MRRSRGIGIVVLVLAGSAGCAGTPQRGRTSSPMEPPPLAANTEQPTGWRGWWARLRPPAPNQTPPAVTDLRIEASRRVGPEQDIWPSRSRSILSRLIPSGLNAKSKAGEGPTLGSTQPTSPKRPTMTAAEANRAIASLARPRKQDKDDDLVLPVRMDGDPEAPLPPSLAARDAIPPDEDAPRTVLLAPIPLPGPLLERSSTQPPPTADAEALPAAAVEPEPEIQTAADAVEAEAEEAEPVASAPVDSPSVELASAAQVPPPPPIRPTPRTDRPTPPAPPITAPPPAPPVDDSAKTDTPDASASDPAPAKPADEAPPPPPATDEAPPIPRTTEPAPEAPSPAVPAVSPAAEAAPAPAPTDQAPTFAASPVPVAPPASAQAAAPVFAARPPTAPTTSTRHWSFLSWLRPQSPRLPHHPGVFPSAQGPVPMPPVLVPTSYHVATPQQAPSAPAPTAQKTCVTPSAQCSISTPAPAPTSHVKKTFSLTSRLHDRLDQYKHWKHEHICKHLQNFKDALAGKNRCSVCGGSGVAPRPSPQAQAQAQPTPQGPPMFPAPLAQAQAEAHARLGLLAEPSHVAKGEQVVERVASEGLDEPSQR